MHKSSMNFSLIILFFFLSCKVQKPNQNFTFNFKPGLGGQIPPGNQPPSGDYIFVADNYFIADMAGAKKLLYLDTQSQVPQPVATLPNGSTVVSKASFNKMIYLALQETKDLSSVGGAEVWVYDPQQSTLSQAFDLNPGSAGSNPHYLKVFDNKLFFRATTASTGSELYYYSPAEGVKLAADVNSGAASSSPSELTVVGDVLYFSALNSSGIELWKFSQGSASLVKDILSGSRSSFPAFLVAHQNELYFSAQSSAGALALWRVKDGTASSITSTEGKEPKFIISAGDYLYMSCSFSNNVGMELCRFNAQNNELSLASDINGQGSSRPVYLKLFNGKIYFQATRASEGRELFVFEPGKSATVVEDIFAGKQGSYPESLFVVGEYLYFSANDNQVGAELWRVDVNGNADRAYDLTPGSGSSHPSSASYSY